jgi:hypothetical protein
MGIPKMVLEMRKPLLSVATPAPCNKSMLSTNAARASSHRGGNRAQARQDQVNVFLLRSEIGNACPKPNLPRTLTGPNKAVPSFTSLARMASLSASSNCFMRKHTALKFTGASSSNVSSALILADVVERVA